MAEVPNSINKTQIQMGHHMNFATNPSGGTSNKGQAAGHLHQRTSSQNTNSFNL